MKKIIVTTTDLKNEYEVLGPVYFQVSNKGIFSSSLSKLIKKHGARFSNLKKTGQVESNQEFDWGLLYGEFSFGMENDFDKAFFVAVRELQIRALKLGADAIIGMRQDIDMDTNHFQYFYLQMYGTAVKFK
ncbi:MAG: heavy metal-binding domain-containing protein [Vicingaceae bacterium]|nr:heavy metal-binding domain-containing protein [Vicingaceae bacterium]